MKDKNIGTILKTESKVIAYVVICLVVIVLGISYALFFEVKGNEKNQIVKAGTLEFTYANGSQITNETNSECFIPMSEEEALKHSECEYKISITNTGTLPGNYNINLNSDAVDKPMALNKLKVILKKEGQVVADYPKDGTTTSLVANEKIEAGSVINYTVQVYVDADNELLNAEDDEKNISLKINGDAVVNGEEVILDTSLAVNFIRKLAKTDNINLIADDTSEANLRYVGSNPNNYIDIGDGSLWRIIGVMNNITDLDNGGQQESLLKIIRAKNIGGYSLDASKDDINNGWGVNEWSDSDLMKLLNPNTVYSGTPEIGGSLYWNKDSGSCYNGPSEKNEICNFEKDGISDEAKSKLSKVRWNTGTVGESYDTNKITPKYMYTAERSSHDGKEQCINTGGNYCNDQILRTTTWDGYIGLMYPSDYGYAVGGSVRTNCIGKNMNDYSNDGCNLNDWLIPSSDSSWTITSLPLATDSNYQFIILSSGSVAGSSCYISGGVLPVGYLKVNTKIKNNPNPDKEYGSINNPFILE